VCAFSRRFTKTHANKVFNDLLFRDIPSNLLRTLNKMKDPEAFLLDHIKKSKERRHINKQLQKIQTSVRQMNTFDRMRISEKGVNLRVKIYCHVGNNGYSLVSKNLIHSMFIHGVNICTHILRIYNFTSNNSMKDELVVSLAHNKLDSYDFVLIHATPTIWPTIVSEELAKNANVKIVGYTVWETNAIPQKWIKCLKEVHKVVVPCEWNRRVFSKQVDKVCCIETPIDEIDEIDEKFVLPFDKDDFVFYTINAWNERKAIDELIACFIKSFEGSKHVKLFIKTFTKNVVDHEQIVVNYSQLTDKQVKAIHKKYQCFVSLSKGEGTGLGACESAISGNPVICAKYGGHKDYLSDAYFVKHKEVSVNLCNKNSNKHNKCKRVCRVHPLYTSDQMWCEPNLGHFQEQMKRVYQTYGSNEMLTKVAKCIKSLRLLNSDRLGNKWIHLLKNLKRID
jgi:glycosyltransferase involved in cell wall biosynthesis